MSADDKIKEGIEDIVREDFEDLRGTIIYEPDYAKRNLMIVGGIIIFFITLLSLWFYRQQGLTEEEILQEDIKNSQKIVEMLADVSVRIQHPQVGRQELMDAVELAIKLSSTSLRQAKHPQSPYIRERQDAFIEALEGLMRLELEGFIDLSKEEDKRYYENLLNSLGRQRVEYYDHGILNRVPLMERAWLDKEIQMEGNHSSHVVKELLAKLAIAEKNESQTIEAPAYLLGRWFRFYNEKEKALRCFHIGRKYIDGYEIGGKYYQGKSIEVISPAWDEYAGCLEALAEDAFFRKKYRQARSYLVRIFDTPKGNNTSYLGRSLSTQIEENKVWIQRIRGDMEVIQRVLSSVSELPSFPLFHPNDSILHWDALLAELRVGYSASGKKVTDFAWERLERRLKDEITMNKGVQWLTYSVKKSILEALNALVRSPTFFQEVFYDKKNLSERSKKFLEKSTYSSLSPEEYMFLNRDIVDLSFPKAIVNEYLLSDGTRLNNALDAEQTAELVGLYQEEVGKSEIDQRRKNSLQKEIKAIYRGDKQVTLFDLKTKLKEKITNKEQSIAENEKIFDSQRTILSNVQEEMRELEEKGKVDVARILKLQSQEELARSRQRQAKIRIKKLKLELGETNEAYRDLNRGFRDRLDSLDLQLSRALSRESQLREKNLVEKGPLISQIEHQIDLREKYLLLLTKLKEKGGETILKDLEVEKVELKEKIASLKKEMKKVSGNKREQLEGRLNVLEKKRYALVKRFNELFDPLREAVSAISSEEEKIWDIEDLLRKTQEEIATLVGTANRLGTLEKKAKRRSELLLDHSSSLFEKKAREKEIQELNEEVRKDHVRLQVLLQTERFAKSTVEAFFPYVGDYTTFSLREGDLAQLQNYLERQDQLIQKYENLWKQKSLQEVIYQQEAVILENMKLISSHIDTLEVFSEKQINDLSRYMENILLSRRELKKAHRLLSILSIGESSQKAWEISEGAGYVLESVELFQMEQEIGLSISKYRYLFEDRKQISAEVQLALDKKKVLEEKKLVAVRKRDQVEVDVLLPKIIEVEREIAILSSRRKQVNEQLRLLADEYAQRLDSVYVYRNKLRGQMVDVVESLGVIQKDLVENDKELENLRAEIFWTAGEFGKSITNLSIGKLQGIDELIEEQKDQLNNLHQVYGVKLREDFYKAKALWLIGKSFEEQSHLETFDQLIVSNDLPKALVDEESRIGQLIIKEFNPRYIYSEEMFGEGAEEVDSGDVNYDAWVDFLENSALKIFNEELPNYGFSQLGGGSEKKYGGLKKQDNDSFTARSHFLSGEIYMRRALRFIRSSRASPEENIQARKELDAATRAFLGYLDFAVSLMRESKQSLHTLTEPTFSSSDFPQRLRSSVNFIDEARIYLGIIANLKGDSLEAISYYRQILVDMLREVSLDIEQEEKAVGEIDPVLLEDYQFDLGIHPYYASLLAQKPCCHEVLYRLGKSYSFLAHKEIEKKLHNPLEGPARDQTSNQLLVESYARKAVAYYSQLILTLSYSPYRRAAYLQRGLLRKTLGDYENARKDFIAILGSPYSLEGGFDQEMMNTKGDLPGELNPGYAYVAFELGDLYFQNHDYAAAAEVFRRAQEGDPNNIYVLQSKIAYAHALMKTENWLMADYFLSTIASERKNIVLEKKHYYHADILVDLGFVRKQFFNFKSSLEVFKSLFREYAPVELVDSEGDLILSNIHGLAVLETDYRDAIRPLALSCLYSAEIFLIERNYTFAKKYYQKAQTLFKMLPWKEDRILRNLNKEEFDQYRKEYILKSSWGGIKTDILELVFSTFSRFRRMVGRGIEEGDFVDPNRVLREVEQVIEQASSQERSYQELLGRVEKFYSLEKEKLPELIEKKRIQSIREWDRQVGGQSIRRYDALVYLRDFIMKNMQSSPIVLIGDLMKSFERESLEDLILNDFVLEYAKRLRFTQEDRKRIIPLNSNLDNLLEIENANERLKDFAQVFQRGLEKRMRMTGFDDLFIPVSPQAKVLEEIDLYRVSLLAHLENFDNYMKLTEIVETYLDEEKIFPNRIQTPETIWMIVEIGAMIADHREDWFRSEQYHHYLLREDNEPFFLQLDFSDRYRAEIAYARAIIRSGKIKIDEAAFIENEAEKQLSMEKIQEKFTQARNLLIKLMDLKGDSGPQVLARIQAKEMLSEINAL